MNAQNKSNAFVKVCWCCNFLVVNHMKEIYSFDTFG